MAAPAVATSARVGAAAWGSRERLPWLALALLAAPLLLVGAIAAVLSATIDIGGSAGPSRAALADIPGDYLQLYVQAGQDYGIDWAILAAIGKIETDHGRSAAVGVGSGVNFAGCCAGPMQFDRAGTWPAYGVDGDDDGDKDIYDPADAIPAAGRYLVASGAKRDMREAIFAYNHAGWYVDQVLDQAAEYRAAAPLEAAGGAGVVVAGGGRWLAPVPGGRRAVCDRRIVADVALLVRVGRLAAGDCYAPTGHATAGEHPMGLALDAVPADGNWRRVEQLARQLGWDESCAAQGCAGRGPLRVVLYNGFPDHGDPAHAGGNAHIHFSWDHSPTPPGQRAAQVRVMLGRGGLDEAALPARGLDR